MALNVQTWGNSGKLRENFEYLFFKSRKTQGNFFCVPIFWFSNWLLNKLSVKTVIFHSVIQLRTKSGEDTPQGKRVKIGHPKSVEDLYGWWSTHFLLVKNLEKRIFLLLHSRKMIWLFELKLKMFWTFLSEHWNGLTRFLLLVIYNALHNLVSFAQFKKREKHPRMSVTFSFLRGCFSCFLSCTNVPSRAKHLIDVMCSKKINR